MENPDYNMPDISLPTDGKPLVVGVAADREPSTFLSPSGDIIGLDGELGRRIAKFMNRPIEFVDMQMSAFPSALDSGKVDVVVSNFIITNELKEMVDFSEPYFSTPFIMVVKKEADL
jgi:polar amino acid transport system substrate-binding protein